MSAPENPSKPAVPSDPVVALKEQLSELKSGVQSGLRDLVRAKKALEALCRGDALQKGSGLDEHLRHLQAANLTPLGLEEKRQAAVAALEQHQERQIAARRMRFMQEITAQAREDGIEVTRLSETPLTLFLFPLTVEVDLAAQTAQILYARELVQEVELDGAAVLRARAQAVDQIREQSVDSAEFFDLLRRAYEMVLLARGAKIGERVDLVDLLLPLAVLRVESSQWRKTEPAKLDEYPRYLLAYQLQRLRKDGLLKKDGRRVDLGTATGGSTRNKRDVLFVPTAGAEGQYYLSVRLV